MTSSSAERSDYTLLRALGRGNTSQVHLAQRAGEARYVALKLPLASTLGNHEAAERFGNEVRLTLRFRHPHIVRGYAGTAFGPGAFLALEYYPQGPLSDVLSQRGGEQLPQQEALRILADVAAALTYLHKLQAVHQDVKPQNVYVDGGRAALGDLGSAYFVSQRGQVSGSPFYMAPEVYHGESTSSSSDVYSFGVMAYELLTGERPFKGSSYEELMVAHLTRFPTPLGHLRPDLSRSLTRLIEQSHAKKPGDRPPADALRRALLRSLGEEPQEELTGEEDRESAGAGGSALSGRHGPAPTPAAPPSAAKDTERSRGWNPFKRRK